jgi:hypothetical protein
MNLRPVITHGIKIASARFIKKYLLFHYRPVVGAYALAVPSDQRPANYLLEFSRLIPTYSLAALHGLRQVLDRLFCQKRGC